MIEIKEIEKLAQLARLELKEEEKAKLQQDLESILNYVSDLQSAPSAGDASESHYLRNVMRDDGDHYTAGEFTEELLAEVPQKDDNYVKVKKILG